MKHADSLRLPPPASSPLPSGVLRILECKGYFLAGQTAYEKAKASGKYEHVERKDSEGSITLKRAYAMENPQEYFAESTEACFSRNDFFPFTRAELKQHDPEMFALLEKLWNEPTE